MDYLDFELEVTRVGGRDCEIASRSPAGEARVAARFPFDDIALKSSLQALQLTLRRPGGVYRRVRSTEEQVVEDFGLALFNFLIAGQVRAAYDVSKREAVAAGKGLRLVLRIRDPELAALPWEFLYDPYKAEYVCLSRHTPVVRYPDLPQPVQPLAVRPPLRILGMAVSPSDLDPLDMEREKLRVEEAVGRLRGQVSLEWLGGGGWRDVLDAMRGGPWHVFHFIGHGGFNRRDDEGFVAVAGDDGRAYELSATKLARLLDHPHLKLVLLNACEGAHASGLDIFSSTASILVRSGIPSVLAMQYEITDAAAIEFSHSFYRALAGGMPVEAAVSDARKAVSVAVNNTVEWGTPVLYLRARDGRLFDIGLRREQVEALYGDAKKALKEGDWDAAIEKLTVVINTDRASDEARAALQHAVEQRTLSDLYAEGLRHYEEGRWAEAHELFAQIEARAAGYRDTGALAESARRELHDEGEEERLQRAREAEERALESEAQQATGEDAGGEQAQAAAAVEPEPAPEPAAPTYGLRPTGGVRVNATTFNKWRVVNIVLSFLIAAVCLALISTVVSTPGRGRAGNSAPTLTPAPTPPKVVQGGPHVTVEPLGEVTSGYKLRQVAFSPDGQTLATVGDDSGVGLWSVDDRILYTYLRSAPSRSVAFSLDGMTVASGDDEGKIRLWGLQPAVSYPADVTWQGHDKWVSAVAFSADSADGRILTSAGGDGTIRYWSVSDGEQLEIIKLPPKNLLVALDPGVHVAALYLDLKSDEGMMSVWSLDERHSLKKLRAGAKVTCGAFSHDGAMLATGDLKGTVRLWRVGDGELLFTKQQTKSSPTSMAFRPDRHILAVGWSDGFVRLWSVGDGSLLKEWKEKEGSVNNLVFSADGRTLAAGGGTHLALWRVTGY